MAVREHATTWGQEDKGKIGDVGVHDLRGSDDDWGRYHIECVLTPRLTRPRSPDEHEGLQQHHD